MSDDVERILVVDDELGIREGCRKICLAEGYEVETAKDGMAGLEVYRKFRNFDAVLVDLKMPRMGGIDFIRAVRQEDEDVLLFVITAYATIDTAVEAVKLGAHDYVPKPFTPDELLIRLKNGLRSRTLALEAKRLREERERHLLEVAFEQSKSHTIINCMADGVLVVNRVGQVVLRNSAMARILPAAADVALPAPLDGAVGNEELRQMLAKTLQAEGTFFIESHEILVDARTYTASASPVIDPGGDVLGAVAVLRDETELKKLEKAKLMFMSMVAHEVKNPIAAIESYLRLILSGLVKFSQEKIDDMMQKSLVKAVTLRTMVDELLNLTAIQTGHFVVRRADLDVKEVLAEAVESCRDKARARETELALEAEAPLKPILADKDAVLRIFTNLIDNAVKYTPEKGAVTVRAEEDGMYAMITVRDTGIGMSADEMAGLFEEFYRVKNEYTIHVPGTGLGLSLTRQLVEMHQGRIAVESVPGQGSTFTVWLPHAED